MTYQMAASLESQWRTRDNLFVRGGVHLDEVPEGANCHGRCYVKSESHFTHPTNAAGQLALRRGLKAASIAGRINAI
jgi:hypothetical protein